MLHGYRITENGYYLTYEAVAMKKVFTLNMSNYGASSHHSETNIRKLIKEQIFYTGTYPVGCAALYSSVVQPKPSHKGDSSVSVVAIPELS